jgi:hypothetical protein
MRRPKWQPVIVLVLALASSRSLASEATGHREVALRAVHGDQAGGKSRSSAARTPMPGSGGDASIQGDCRCGRKRAATDYLRH